MRILILDNYYPPFLSSYRSEHTELAGQPYDEQWRSLMAECFGTADFYSHNLQRLGQEATELITNDEILQKRWAAEHGVKLDESKKWTLARRRGLPVPRRVPSEDWFYTILAAQIKHYKPDILFNQEINSIRHQFLNEMKPHVGLIVGQHAASQLSEEKDWSVYDLIISSFPPTLEWLRKRDVPAELLRLGFEPRVLAQLESDGRKIPVSFVGSFHPVHSTRVEWLEYLCSRLPVEVWSPDVKYLSASSSIRGAYRGSAWGASMYQTLRDSLITLNHHGNIPPHANNLRLFEATGVGAMLITDWKVDIEEIFQPGKEVVTYRTPEECAELVQYYLEHADEREAIARAGRERTLREHTYYQRMQELLTILERHLAQRGRAKNVLTVGGSAQGN